MFYCTDPRRELLTPYLIKYPDNRSVLFKRITFGVKGFRLHNFDMLNMHQCDWAYLSNWLIRITFPDMQRILGTLH